MIKCICINDRKKPKEIPDSHWVKYGQVYTISTISHLIQSDANIGVTLKEIDLKELNMPYECFLITRFAFREEDLPALMILIENCKNLQNFDIDNLIEQEILTGKSLKDFDDYAESVDDDKSLGDL